MNSVFLLAAVAICLISLLSLYRSIVGPTILDRIVGINALGTKTTVLLLLIGLLFDRVDMFIDISIAYSLLNFITVLASARYFHKKKGLHGESLKRRTP
ncbi:MAG: monovalent cation/H+ antiporter complex subunit F [Desulfobacterales bacterium]|nr:monovalent cation/H+ antiporter complex subunit F [Desulfobacterales bacterium]